MGFIWIMGRMEWVLINYVTEVRYHTTTSTQWPLNKLVPMPSSSTEVGQSSNSNDDQFILITKERQECLVRAPFYADVHVHVEHISQVIHVCTCTYLSVILTMPMKPHVLHVHKHYRLSVIYVYEYIWTNLITWIVVYHTRLRHDCILQLQSLLH